MILAITVYAGSKELVQMTEDMLQVFMHQKAKLDEEVVVTAVCNGAERPVAKGYADHRTFFDENVGFGKAVNKTIEIAIACGDQFTDVLVMNNDLEFPNEDWLRQLIEARDGKRVVSPMTDKTAAKSARSKGPINKSPFQAAHVSAFCWLVPRSVISMFRGRYRYPLFDPDFFAYGEDDLAAAIMRKWIAPKPFTVVPRAWVRHLRNKTGKEMGLKGGMDGNVAMLKKKMKRLGLR